VKSFVAISFILLHLFSTTELGELLKLPVLVHHYFEHEEEHEHLSFIGFFKAHYAELHKAEGKHHNEDHQRLPFKGHDHHFLTVNISAVPRAYTCVQPSVYCEAKKSFINKRSILLFPFSCRYLATSKSIVLLTFFIDPAITVGY
jgi:hypothetical protein